MSRYIEPFTYTAKHLTYFYSIICHKFDRRRGSHIFTAKKVAGECLFLMRDCNGRVIMRFIYELFLFEEQLLCRHQSPLSLLFHSSNFDIINKYKYIKDKWQL